MKIKTTAIIAALLLSVGVAFAATNDITALLQKGLFEEEANHNLEAAMRQYQAAVDGFDQDRQLAATAVFRLGECYRKLGKTNEAMAQYQRVIKDFSDQAPLAKLSREYLAGTAVTIATVEASTGATATSAEDEEVRHIRELIRNSPDLINAAEGVDGVTPLQSKVYAGNIAAAELLLENGADPNLVGPRGLTPLGLAADMGNKAMIELLLAKGADINAKDQDKKNQRRTALDHAVGMGFKSVVEVLLAHKAIVNPTNSEWPPLHRACSEGYTAVAGLLIANGADVNARTPSGETPLFATAIHNQPAAAQFLIANKADVNATNAIGRTALFLAAQNGASGAEVARLLLEAGADPNVREKSGLTPLLNAARDNQAQIAKLLLQHKADANAAGNDGVTPLLYAVRRQDVDLSMVEEMLAAGANTQATCTSRNEMNLRIAIYPGMLPLNVAIMASRVDVMEALLTAHADPNAYSRVHNNQYDFEGTALHWAIDFVANPSDKVKVLLEHGANPDLTDDEGQTPLVRAVRSGDMDSIQILLDHHADPNIADNTGRPPLAYAANPSPVRSALLRGGANEDYQRLARIYVAQKGTGSLGTDVFYRGTNSVNQFNLLEAFTAACHDSLFPPVDFADLAHVVINRLKPDGSKQEIAVNLEEILSTGDCARNLPLEWGDVVQIPQKDHLINEPAPRMEDGFVQNLIKCQERQVAIVVKGQTTKLTLRPEFAENWVPRPSGISPALVGKPQSFPVQKPAGGDSSGRILYTFLLNRAVHEANVLLLSSDLSHVKVVRHGQELHFDLSPLPSNGPGPFMPGAPVGRGGRGIRERVLGEQSRDLWLQDGDVIEIPERDPNSPVKK